MAKAKKLPSGNYRVQATVIVDNKKIKRSFTALTAKQAENEAYLWQNHCRMIGKDSTRMTVKEAMEDYISTNEKELSPSTVREYSRIKNNDMQDIIDKRLYSLTCPIIKNSMNKAAAKGLSSKTIKNRYGFLQRILSVYYPDFIWAVSYPKQKKKPKKMFSNEQIKRIFKALKGTDFECEAYLGMLSLRASEIAGLKWDDIDFKSKTINLCRAKVLNKDNDIEEKDETKTKMSTRIVYMPDYLCKILAKRRLNSQSEYFTDIPPNRFWAHFNSILKRNKIKPMPFHDLRHIYSSVSSSLGIDTQIRMLNGGWSNEHIMNGIYRHPMTEAQEEANTKMNDYVNSIAEVTTKVTTKNRKRLKLVRFNDFL